MKLPVFACLVAACAAKTSLSLAATPTKDVKVCVRIEEKSWSREGTATPGAAAPAPATDGAAARPPAPAADASSTPAQPSAPASPGAVPPGDGGAPDNSTAIAPDPTLAGDPSHKAVPASKDVHAEELVDAEDANYFAVDPVLYLRRLIEYQVTHEPGFESVRDGCTEHLVVELYPVRHGWTAFARYSGNAREEKVDVVHLDELGIFAERVTTALLRDKSISETLTRRTVLRADSEARVRRIQTRPHLLLAMGSGARVGKLPTAPNATDPAVERLRIETPLEFAIGVRNKFRAWALDATARLDAGVTERAARQSAGGGNVDYSLGLGLGLGFLAYGDPDAVNTPYYGGGASFELSRYRTQGAREASGYQPDPGELWGGGLDVNLILGYEFMRTSSLHFFVQGLVSIPAYVFDSENDQSRIHAYIPSGSALVGLLF
jgi:hypothetical protein